LLLTAARTATALTTGLSLTLHDLLHKRTALQIAKHVRELRLLDSSGRRTLRQVTGKKRERFGGVTVRLAPGLQVGQCRVNDVHGLLQHHQTLRHVAGAGCRDWRLHIAASERR
jgi:hypothetical protein